MNIAFFALAWTRLGQIFWTGILKCLCLMGFFFSEVVGLWVLFENRVFMFVS